MYIIDICYVQLNQKKIRIYIIYLKFDTTRLIKHVI